ncbi:hypothetical protein WBG78_28725 [Chryseolinea sp. T2]|uniref:hypothetical protein n=1 Tax=Chryseolinea sp. T2 TaxID=3129255 RepID=UPI00307787A0
MNTISKSRNAQGGKSKEAGRRKGERTIVMRVPVSKISEVQQVLNPSPLDQIYKDVREIASYFGGYEELREVTHMLEAGIIGPVSEHEITITRIPGAAV